MASSRISPLFRRQCTLVFLRKLQLDNSKVTSGPYPQLESNDRVIQFYKDHFRQFVAELRSAFGSGPPDPEDVAQQAFEKLLRHDDPSSPIRNVKAYIWQVARNIIISDLRRQQTTRQRDQDYSAHHFDDGGYLLSPERVLESRQQIKRAELKLAAMPPQRRKAFVLVRFENMTQLEAARQLGISRPAVTKHIAKATKELLEALLNDDAG